MVVNLRYLFERMNSYNEATTYLQSADSLEPAYYTLGGVAGNDAIIISHSGKAGALSSLPNVTLAQTGVLGQPWILQTNYDHGSNELVTDDRLVVECSLVILKVAGPSPALSNSFGEIRKISPCMKRGT